MKIEITDKLGKVLFSNLTEFCNKCKELAGSRVKISPCELSEENRFLIIDSQEYSIFLCGNKDELRNNRIINYQIELLRQSAKILLLIKDSIYEEIYSKIRKRYDSIVHNIKTLNTQNSQLIYNYAPMLFADNVDNRYSIIKDAIEDADIKKTTLLIFQLLKNLEHISNEFITHDNLFINNPKLSKAKHPLHKLILNAYQTFFLDFKQNKIEFKIDNYEKRINVDYNTFSLGLYHIFLNAVKYIKPNTVMQVSFEESRGKLLVVFSMNSLFIEQDEIDKIFEDGYSGKHPTALNKKGNGLGMNIIKKAIELNGGQFFVRPGTIYKEHKKINYAYNKFIIEFDASYISK